MISFANVPFRYVTSIATALQQQEQHGQHYTKRFFMSRVVVIPNEGRARVAMPALLLVSKNLKSQKEGERGHARPSFFWYENGSGH